VKSLTRDDLFTLEEYAERRPEFRAGVLEHKKNRQVAVGPNATLSFEDRRTIQYQVQEMLRIERIFEAAGIEDELGAYNPLIPDGGNLKATFMLEFTDVDERREALQALHGIEDRVWLSAGGGEPVWAVADEARRRFPSSDQVRRADGHRHRSRSLPPPGGSAERTGAGGSGCGHRVIINIQNIP
jgi:hypothetical protein